MEDCLVSHAMHGLPVIVSRKLAWKTQLLLTILKRHAEEKGVHVAIIDTVSARSSRTQCVLQTSGSVENPLELLKKHVLRCLNLKRRRTPLRIVITA